MSGRFTSIGETFRRLPILGLDSEKDGAEAVTVEMYELPAPLPAEDNSPAVYDAWEQTDPVASFIWAHTADITLVKEADIYQYGADVRRVLVMRKLSAIGYLNSSGEVADLGGLTDRGTHILQHLHRPEIQALLSVIRYAEGTLGERGYNTGFNYNPIHDLSRHPMTVWGGSSASGAYQFMNYTWPGVASAAGLRDFTPLSQDIAALYQVQHKHGIKLENVNSDNLEQIVHKLGAEWASLPQPNGMSKYTFKGRPQPAKSMGSLKNQWQRAMGGDLPRMGYNWYHWNDASHNALKNFQHAYEVEPTGNLNQETYRAVFNGEFGSYGAVLAQKRAEEEAAKVIAQLAPKKSFAEVSPHNIAPAKIGEKIGGYPVSSLFGPRKSPCAGCSSFHPAWDIATPNGTPIYAPFDGIEVSTFYTEGSGHVLRFTHDGMQYSLLHMSKVMPGGYEKGWVMGYTGASARGTGPHLDVRVKQNGEWVLPSKEVIHFMLDPTAFENHAPDPQPETIVSPEPAGEDEIEKDETPETEESRNFLRRLFGRIK